jgi:RNA polymerase sigma-70 factor (ECF subfamily)
MNTGVQAPSAGASVPLDDLLLVSRFKQGDEAAFDQIVQRYQERIFRFAFRLLQDFDGASDVAQETFIRAYENLGRFRGQAGLYTWLYRIAYNISINTLRRNKLYYLFSLNDEVNQSLIQESPERDLDRAELEQKLEEAVQQLPPRQRSIFALRHFEGLPHRQIAQIAGCSEGAVRASYFHAVRKLQQALREYVQ